MKMTVHKLVNKNLFQNTCIDKSFRFQPEETFLLVNTCFSNEIMQTVLSNTNKSLFTIALNVSDWLSNYKLFHTSYLPTWVKNLLVITVLFLY